LGGADEVLDVFSGGGAGAEDRAEAFFGDAEDGHDHQAGGGDDDAQPADVKPTLRVYLALEVTRVLLTLRGPILKLLGPVPW